MITRTPVSKLLTLTLLGCLSLSLAGCDIKLPPMPWDPPKKEEHATDEAAIEGEGEEGGGVEIEPVDMSKLLPEAMRNLPYEEVTIPMRDRLELYGRLYDPSLTKDEEGDTISPGEAETEYTGPKYPLVILLHGLNRNYLVWNDLPALLVKAGYAVYTPDLRGHGKSTRISRGPRLNWRMMNEKGWQQLPDDVNQIIKYFQKATEDYPEVGTAEVALVGEKLGANVATMTTKKDTGRIQTLVLISPGISFKNIDATRGLLGYTKPTLILVGQDEEEAHTSAQHLYNWVNGPKALYEYKSGQGADILSSTNASSEQIRDWLIDKMPPGGTPKPTDAKPSEKKPAEAKTASSPEHAPASKPVPEAHSEAKPAAHPAH